MLDRLATPPVALLFQLGFALLAAFVAGAATQRVLLGRYGFSIGPLQLPEISEKDVADLGRTVISELLPATGTPAATVAELTTATADPNLQLVALRIEIEKRLRNLAQQSGVAGQRLGAGQLIRILAVSGVLTQDAAAALADLIGTANQAAHGVEVSQGAGEWASREGPRILAALDSLIPAAHEHTMA